VEIGRILHREPGWFYSADPIPPAQPLENFEAAQ
jgi:hypothetical protein